MGIGLRAAGMGVRNGRRTLGPKLAFDCLSHSSLFSRCLFGVFFVSFWKGSFLSVFVRSVLAEGVARWCWPLILCPLPLASCLLLLGSCLTCLLPHMGWLRLVGSLKLYVSLKNIGLFCRALLQKRPIILRSLLAKATPYASCL